MGRVEKKYFDKIIIKGLYYVRRKVERKEIKMRKPKINNDFTNDFNYVKKNVKPGCAVLMKDHRAFDGEYHNNRNKAFKNR